MQKEIKAEVIVYAFLTQNARSELIQRKKHPYVWLYVILYLRHYKNYCYGVHYTMRSLIKLNANVTSRLPAGTAVI
jgi:hypothetical protein